MKKIISYILIFFIFVNLFAPVSLELSNGNIKVSENNTEALTSIDGTTTIDASTLNANDIKIRNDAKVQCLNTAPEKEYCFKVRWVITGGKLFVIIYTIGVDRAFDDDYTLTIKMANPDGTNFNPNNPNKSTAPDAPLFNTGMILDGGKNFQTEIIKEDTGLSTTFLGNTDKFDGYLIENKIGIDGLVANTPYTMDISLVKMGGVINVVQGGEKVHFDNVQYSSQTTQTYSESSTIGNNGNNNTNNSSSMPACSMNPVTLGSGTPMGCVAQGIYYVLFQTTSYLFALAGTLFDNAFAYSVDDNSYRSAFVVEGWKVVRDFCNMFFIFILLYIAFGTILNLNGVKTKEMIINVVIIGIFINFSLFASQVIIDSSNILARVFYNSNTITVKIEDAAVGSGVIPLSSALVNKINPQNIILSASQVNTVSDTRGKAGSETGEVTTSNGVSTGTFILVTILATMVNLVGVFVFLSIALIFIARVIGLWLAMIFVPFAFLSYTVPAMQGLDMVGWKKWWPETLKLAFLAPVFIFFLYLILQFLETGLGLVKTDASAGGLSFMVGIILPFAFIMILLLKAKGIATDMSGKIGEAISKAGSTVAGFALGAATGGAAFMARGTLGRAGNLIANNEKLKDAEAKGGVSGFFAKNLRNIGTATGKGSFDVRATKLGAQTAKATGLNLGKAGGVGGFEKSKAEQIAKAQNRAKELELGETSPEKQALNKKQEALKILENENGLKVERADAAINIARQASQDADIALRSDPNNKEKQDAAVAASKALEKAKKDKANIRTGGATGERNVDGSMKYNTHNGKISEMVIKNAVDEATKDQKDATSAEATALASGTAASEAIANITTATNTAATDRSTAIANAATAEKNAIDKAALDKAAAYNKAAADVASAVTAAATAEMAFGAGSAEATTAKLAITEAQGHEVTLKSIADTNHNDAIAKAAADRSTAELAAATAEAKAIADAEAIKDDAIVKATADQKTAVDARNKATDSGTAAAEAMSAGAAAEASGGIGRSMNDLQFTDIPDAQHAISHVNNRRKFEQATALSSTPSKIFNMISSGGMYSVAGANEAAHNIRMNVKETGSGGAH